MTLKELQEKYEALAKRLHDIFAEAGETLDMSKVKLLDGDSTSKAKQIAGLNGELAEIKKQIEGLEELDEARKAADAADRYLKSSRGSLPAPGSTDPRGDDGRRSIKTLGQLIGENESYKAFRERGGGTAVFEFSAVEAKTLLTLGDINNPATRLTGIRTSAQEERTVRDLMLQGETDNNAITYMEETTFTNNADTVAEGAPKPESELDFTERTDNVRKIATWIPATTELLTDVRGFESYIRERLSFMVRRKEEQQLLLGDGVAPNILGVELRTGVQTQAKGADPVPDAIYKGMNLVRTVGFAEPTAVVMHPNDWMDVRLLRTADGVYIWGSPSEAGLERIWGLEVRQTTAQTENTAFTGAFRPMAQVFQREGVTITISTEHSDFFVKNKVAILAEERLALAVYRPAAFAKITGI